MDHHRTIDVQLEGLPDAPPGVDSHVVRPTPDSRHGRLRTGPGSLYQHDGAASSFPEYWFTDTTGQTSQRVVGDFSSADRQPPFQRAVGVDSASGSPTLPNLLGAVTNWLPVMLPALRHARTAYSGWVLPRSRPPFRRAPARQCSRLYSICFRLCSRHRHPAGNLTAERQRRGVLQAYGRIFDPMSRKACAFSLSVDFWDVELRDSKLLADRESPPPLRVSPSERRRWNSGFVRRPRFRMDLTLHAARAPSSSLGPVRSTLRSCSMLLWVPEPVCWREFVGMFTGQHFVGGVNDGGRFITAGSRP